MKTEKDKLQDTLAKEGPNSIRGIKARLKYITRECREDMHEPDEQGLKAYVIGNKLDNAMGTSIMDNPRSQEFVVFIEDEGTGDVDKFNLADLIALARQAKLKPNLSVV